MELITWTQPHEQRTISVVVQKKTTGSLQQDRQPVGQMAKAANSLQRFLPRVVVLELGRML